MPFSIADTVNSTSRSILKSTTVRSIMSNPIYTGVVVSFVIMLITAFVYRDADVDWASSARVAIWSFFVLMCTFALHRMVIREEMRSDIGADQTAQIFGSNDILSLMKQDIVPVTIGESTPTMHAIMPAKIEY